LARSFAVYETIRPSRVEPQDPIPNGLKADATDARRLPACAAVIDLGKRQEPRVTLPSFVVFANARSPTPLKSPRKETGAPMAKLLRQTENQTRADLGTAS
jgi:hypothetical protein